MQLSNYTPAVHIKGREGNRKVAWVEGWVGQFLTAELSEVEIILQVFHKNISLLLSEVQSERKARCKEDEGFSSVPSREEKTTKGKLP